MNSFNRQLGLVLGTLFLAMVALAPAALAGDYHTGTGLRCSDCHIMHASKDGVEVNGGAGYGSLLKSDTANTLCLTCHDGTDTTAPDVVATGVAAGNSIDLTTDTLTTGYTSQWKSSAGYFQSDATTVKSIFGHNLGGGQETAVQGTWTSGTNGMECVDCHNPHGSANYRNLVTQPGGAPAVTVRGGVSGTQEVYLREDITIPATPADTAIHYDTDAVRFNDPNNIVAWCKGCHTNIDNSANKHPQDHTITGTNVSSANWDSGVAGTDPGFGTTVDWGSGSDRGVPRLRFAQAGASYADCGTVASATNEVFCLTCHKAHGSRTDSGLNWRHFGKSSSSPDMAAGCNQCHAKGS